MNQPVISRNKWDWIL